MVKGNKENSTKSIGVDLHSLVENINLGVYRTSDSGELLYCNPALARILGYKNIEELKQIPVANHFVNQLDRDSQLQEWKDNKEKISNEVLLKTKSGKQIRIQDTGRIIRGKNREQSYYEGVMEDISKRREIEKELKISEERLKLSLKGSDEKIWDWNAVKGDAYFETLPGYEPGDIEDHYNSWEKLVHPDDLNKVLEILNKHLKGASDFYKAEYRVRNKSGDWIWILGKGKVVERDRNGKALRVVGTHTDITDRVKVRLELERYKDNLEKLVEERTRELLK
ncbi:MAG: PAS domain-containing protein, partial [Candidatus Aminicenantes bacterium]|nr:PAS domain-containing protein [Candidatus Aminicenantes bacterium]